MTAARIFAIVGEKAGFAVETEDLWAIIFLEIAGENSIAYGSRGETFYRDCGVRSVGLRQVVSELAGKGEKYVRSEVRGKDISTVA
jgi:hypothetical protein